LQQATKTQPKYTLTDSAFHASCLLHNTHYVKSLSDMKLIFFVYVSLGKLSMTNIKETLRNLMYILYISTIKPKIA